uniref:Uncharacterized protein n=1 Tax=Parascaris univalens TaxID=6257 RepID=A0A914ZM96_PARUN
MPTGQTLTDSSLLCIHCGLTSEFRARQTKQHFTRRGVAKREMRHRDSLQSTCSKKRLTASEVPMATRNDETHSANDDTPSENWEIKTKRLNGEKGMLHTLPKMVNGKKGMLHTSPKMVSGKKGMLHTSPKMVNGIKGTLHASSEMEGGARQISESSPSKDPSVGPR